MQLFISNIVLARGVQKCDAYLWFIQNQRTFYRHNILQKIKNKNSLLHWYEPDFYWMYLSVEYLLTLSNSPMLKTMLTFVEKTTTPIRESDALMFRPRITSMTNCLMTCHRCSPILPDESITKTTSAVQFNTITNTTHESLTSDCSCLRPVNRWTRFCSIVTLL